MLPEVFGAVRPTGLDERDGDAGLGQALGRPSSRRARPNDDDAVLTDPSSAPCARSDAEGITRSLW